MSSYSKKKTGNDDSKAKNKGMSKISSYFQNPSISKSAVESSKSSQSLTKSQGLFQSRNLSSSSSSAIQTDENFISDDSDVEIIGESIIASNEKETKVVAKPSDSGLRSAVTRNTKTKKDEEKTSYSRTNDETKIESEKSLSKSKRLSLKRKSSNLSKSSEHSSSNQDCISNVHESREKSSRTSIEGSDQSCIPSKCDKNLLNSAASEFESPPEKVAEFKSGLNADIDIASQLENVATVGQDVEAMEPQEASNFTIPYYLQNFESILKVVMEDESFSNLFDGTDHKVIKRFSMLSDGGKKLYVRMFGRKLKWIPLAKLKYDEIAKDLIPYLKELIDLQFIDCEDELNDISLVLGALPAGDVKALAKSYHITAKVTQKKNLVLELLKKTQQTSISAMFGNKGRGGVAIAMLKSAKERLKGVYKLKLAPRSVFVRIMMLFSVVNTTGDEEGGSGGQQQLFQMLMVNMGKVVYPTYEVIKTHRIFKNREDVIRFEEALQLEFDLLTSIEKKNWTGAYDIYTDVSKKVDVLEHDADIVKWNTDLPEYLRSFTATSVLYRLLSIGIDIVQRRKEFKDAVTLLQRLLTQMTYCNSHRGYWWERMALNLDVHLKNPKESLESVKKGLADEHVKVGHRLALYQRAQAICQRPNLKLESRLKELHHEPVREMPKVVIEGRVLHQGMTAAGPRFLTEGSYAHGNAHDMTVCGVEEFVMDHYKKNGFPSSVHAEGSVVTSLFGLFFWDILFMPIPDAFHSPYQAMPLDLYTESFYSRRKEAIDKRVQKLKDCSVEDLCGRLEETWSTHHGVFCVGMNWDRFKSVEHVKDLVNCMGGNMLSGMMARYARCPRHTRSGFPDLTLWNVETQAFKICEVKGPGDKLSHKQILWIDYLLGLGVDAEVCHVKAVAAKKLKPSSGS